MIDAVLVDRSVALVAEQGEVVRVVGEDAPLLVIAERAGLDRDVVVIGALNRVEIWDPERIAAWEAEHSQTFADMSEDILPAT